MSSLPLLFKQTFCILFYFSLSSNYLTPSYIYTNHGIEEPSNFGVRDHFLYLNSGLTYTFNWKK